MFNLSLESLLKGAQKGPFYFGGKVSLFDEVAKTWDEKPSRVINARKVGSSLLELLPVSKSWKVLEIGAGTGLLTFYIQPYVGKIYALDSSFGMLSVLKEKIEKYKVENVYPVLLDAERELPKEDFDLVVLHMTLHHIKDIPSLFKEISQRLKRGGFLAVGDLVKEDGSFHRSNEGVYHFGFSKEEIFNYFKSSLLEPYAFEIVHSIERNGKEYPIFLACARKP